MKFPVHIQADNDEAADGQVPCMCHVFDEKGLVTVCQALQKQYLHVIAWDADGCIVSTYDIR
jgi:hypothetical protein